MFVTFINFFMDWNKPHRLGTHSLATFFFILVFRLPKLIPPYSFCLCCDLHYLLVYVDDILLIKSNFTLVQCLITLLISQFKLRDLGAAHYFLGIKVTLTSMGLMLNQHKYVLDILCRTVCCRVNLLILQLLLLQFGELFFDSTGFDKLFVLSNISPLLD